MRKSETGRLHARGTFGLELRFAYPGRMPGTLVVVEEAFVTRGSGVMILPRITFDGSTNKPFPVTLRLPNGDERAANAVFEVSHIRGASAPFAMLRILDLTPEDVPPGTAILRDA